MKKVLFTVIISLYFAQTLFAEASKETTCIAMEKAAYNLMESRQNGVSFSTSMGLVNKHMSSSPELLDLMQLMVVNAYKVNRYSTEKYKRNATMDFANEWGVACYQYMD